jgi:hypothetical protein
LRLRVGYADGIRVDEAGFDPPARNRVPGQGLCPGRRETASPAGIPARGAAGDRVGDILLVCGNPLKDISILTRYEETINLIMKDGKIYKDCL